VAREPAGALSGRGDPFDAQGSRVELQNLGLAGAAQVAIAERANEDDLAADERCSVEIRRREDMLGIEEELPAAAAYCTITSL